MPLSYTCRYTVVPTILSNGQRLPTTVMFRGLKNVPKGKFPKDIVVTVSKPGVMTSDFMTTVYHPRVSSN